MFDLFNFRQFNPISRNPSQLFCTLRFPFWIFSSFSSSSSRSSATFSSLPTPFTSTTHPPLFFLPLPSSFTFHFLTCILTFAFTCTSLWAFFYLCTVWTAVCYFFEIAHLHISFPYGIPPFFYLSIRLSTNRSFTFTSVQNDVIYTEHVEEVKEYNKRNTVRYMILNDCRHS